MLEKGSIFFPFLQRRARIVILSVLTALFGLPTALLAQVGLSSGQAGQVAQEAGLSSADLVTIIGRIIYVVLGLMGVILLLLIIYAGYLWMTATGVAEQVEKAKKIIKNAIIGLVIVVASFAIASYVIGLLGEATTGGVEATPGRLAGIGFPASAGSLGPGGIIEFHVPERDATGVPRNTAIAIQFKQPIDPASFIAGWTETATTTSGLNSDTMKIYPTGSPSQALQTADARVRYTEDFQSFVIKPVTYLGSPTRNMGYTVELRGGVSGIRLRDGSPAFTGLFPEYIWRFEVSTVVDLTPPRILSVFPVSGGEYAPNIVIQLNFDESVDPTSASGEYQGGRTTNFQNIEVRASPVGRLADVRRPNGTFKISNHFSTVEFTTNVECGVNSCGGTIYCLPFNHSIETIAKAATLDALSTMPMAALTRSGYDGIVDMAGNALDGNGDGVAQGSDSDDAFARGNDHYIWRFGTSGEINRNGPAVTRSIPPPGTSRVPVQQQPGAEFGEVLQASSVGNETTLIKTNEPEEFDDTFWQTPSMEVVTTTDLRIPAFSRILIDHRLYIPATTTIGTPDYDPFLMSGLKNLYQNCFNPAIAERQQGTPFLCGMTTVVAPSRTDCALPPPLSASRPARP